MYEISVSAAKQMRTAFFWAVTQRVKVKVTLEQATKAQRGRRGIALLYL
jgi:hypothetical protein